MESSNSKLFVFTLLFWGQLRIFIAFLYCLSMYRSISLNSFLLLLSFNFIIFGLGEKEVGIFQKYVQCDLYETCKLMISKLPCFSFHTNCVIWATWILGIRTFWSAMGQKGELEVLKHFCFCWYHLWTAKSQKNLSILLQISQVCTSLLFNQNSELLVLPITTEWRFYDPLAVLCVLGVFFLARQLELGPASYS